MDFPKIPISRDEALVLTGRMPKRKDGQSDGQFESAKGSAAMRMRDDWKLTPYKQTGVRATQYDRAQILRRKATMFSEIPIAA